MKRWLGTPKSWKVLFWLHVTFAALGVGAAHLLTDTSVWLRLLDAFFGGFNAALAINAHSMWRMGQSFNDLRKAFDAMAQLNTQLIAGEVGIMIVREHDDDAPIVPNRLH